MEILQAVASDLERILEIQKLAYESEALLNSDWTIAPLHQSLPEIMAEFSEKLFLKAVVQGLLVGSVRAEERGGACHIGRLIVHPDWQGKGIGSALLKNVEEKYFNARRYELFTGFCSENNIRFYEKRGYSSFNREGRLVFMQKRNETT